MPNQLASGRVVKHTPQRQLPLEVVKDRVREALVAQQAAELARKDGEARLAALKQGSAAPALPAAKTVSRATANDVPAPVIDAALKADATQLPALLGVPLGNDGYAVLRVNKVLGRDPAAGDAALAPRPVRASVGQRRNPGVLRRAEDALQGRDQGAGNGRARLLR